MARQWLRDCKAAWVKFNRHQQQGHTVPIKDHSEHCCVHCHTHYVGRYCPQCSMPAGWHRFSSKQLLLNLLDIWGLGNRPIMKSARDLIWRPGYMIRDYLSGHYLSYFPPFKMLAVLIALFASIAIVFGLQPSDTTVVQYIVSSIEKEIHAERSLALLHRVADYIEGHRLYSIILQNILVILAVWLAFRRRSDITLVETIYAMIYINCQFFIFSIVYMLLTWSVPTTGLLPYAVPTAWWMLWLYIDFKQLYGLSWWSTLLRQLLALLIIMVAYFVLITLLSATLYCIELS